MPKNQGNQGNIFKLHKPWEPAGDQPVAISKLLEGLNKGMKKQTLLGATGTGKTFTMANVIAQYNKPTLVIAHNKTLAAQLAQEFREFFPNSADDKSKNYIEFYRQIDLVPDLDDRKFYLQNIKNIKLFFAGKKKQILRNLKKEMNTYAKMRQFEKAGEIKRQIFALQRINDVALIKQENLTKVIIPIVSVVKDDRHKAKGIMGDKKLTLKYEREILLANSEAHRFAITYHKNMRGKNFLK